jgi:hypothetical protein
MFFIGIIPGKDISFIKILFYVLVGIFNRLCNTALFFGGFNEYFQAIFYIRPKLHRAITIRP